LKEKPYLKIKKKNSLYSHPLHIAEKFQNQLEAGLVNKADLARRHGMSRARVTQIMNLLKLSPEIRGKILNLSDKEQSFFTERKLRKIVRLSSPKRQLHAFINLKSGID
jgi:hypothetical protein